MTAWLLSVIPSEAWTDQTQRRWWRYLDSDRKVIAPVMLETPLPDLPPSPTKDPAQDEFWRSDQVLSRATRVLRLSSEEFYLVFKSLSLIFSEAAPRTRLAGLQPTVTALPKADYKTEVLDSLLSMPTNMWAVTNKDKLSYERQWS